MTQLSNLSTLSPDAPVVADVAPPLDLPHPQLAIEPWPDPVIDRLGHDPRSAYVERFWLSILGPSKIV